ncbi:MAG: zinc ribbon domain-containing protein [Planctomycetaceae bacterium]
MSLPTDRVLPELHRLLTAMEQCQEEIDRGPRQLRARGQTTAARQQALDDRKQAHKQLRLLSDQKSLQLKSNETKLGDLRGKLNQASSNREFDAIKVQIEADKVANSVLEDEILETLEKVDQAQVDIRRLEEELAAAKAEEERYGKQVAAALPGLEQRLAGLQSDLAEVETRLPPEVLPAYRRLVQAHGAGALAAVDNATCTSCYVRLTSQNAVSITQGQMMFCRTCGRLLYAADENAG